MKLGNLSIFLLLLSVLLLSGKTYSQDQFEGKITLNVYEQGKTHPIDFIVKGDKIRLDANEEGHQAQIIMDRGSKQVMIIMPEQKMYMAMAMPDVKGSENSESSDDNSKLVKTGETKEILGHTAYKYVYKDEEKSGEAWMTDEIGAFRLFDNPMQKNKPEWQKEIEAAGLFPLEVSENGAKVMEVTNIEKKSFDASMFEAPADYQKMDMPSMQQK